LEQEGKNLMSELQGPRIPGEEGSGRGRRLGWIVVALVALILLALLVPPSAWASRWKDRHPQRYDVTAMSP
jgi:lipopolysaccharide/colanic/teichoic acid biosynthesis glycosyltransferase